METLAKIIVKWSGKEYEVTLTENDTVADLKEAIQKATGVRPDRQKLLNLKLKGNAVGAMNSFHKNALQPEECFTFTSATISLTVYKILAKLSQQKIIGNRITFIQASITER